MPRDASATRLALLGAGEQLFARHGVDGARAAEINRAAGQSNESALQYHFGSREGLLVAIFRKHLDATEPARRAAVAALGEEAGLDDLVGVLVAADAERLHHDDGRNYLRIIVQVAGRADVQRGHARLPVDDSVLTVLIDRIVLATGDLVGEALARERVAAAIGFLTFALADRARRIDEGEPLLLDHDAFVADLAAMLVGGLTAPARR